MKILSKGIIIFLTLLFLMNYATAHQPRVVFERVNTEENPIIVKDPETSKAYYGELKESTDNYIIKSDQPFTLYLNILVPYSMNYKEDFIVEARDYTNREILTLNGEDYEWKLFHEPFGNDNYMQGPEARINLSEGIYYINVSSTDNRGKYSLAIGERETFPLNEIIKTFCTIPKIKTKFFGGTFISSFYNFMGLAMLITLLVIILIIAVLVKVFKKKKRIINPPKRLTH